MVVEDIDNFLTFLEVVIPDSIFPFDAQSHGALEVMVTLIYMHPLSCEITHK